MLRYSRYCVSVEISRGRETSLYFSSLAGIIENVLRTTLLRFGEAKSSVAVRRWYWD